MLLFKGECGLNEKVSPSLIRGSVLASAVPEADNFGEDDKS